MNQEQLGKNIMMLRRNAGMSQKELASKLQVSPSALCKWEKGQNCPDITMVQNIAEALSVSCGELLREDNLAGGTVENKRQENSGNKGNNINNEKRRSSRTVLGAVIGMAICLMLMALIGGWVKAGEKESFAVVDSRLVEDVRYGTIWELAVVYEEVVSLQERFDCQEELQKRWWNDEYPELDTAIVRIAFYRLKEEALSGQESTHFGYITAKED